MQDLVIVIVTSAGGGAVIKGLIDYVAQRRAADGTRERAQLDTTSEIRRAEIEAETSTEARLWDRVTQLEQRMDAGRIECKEDIARAVAAEREACNQMINAKLRSQAAQLRAEIKRGIQEASEVTSE